MKLRIFTVAGALLLTVACHPSRPVVDVGTKPDVGGSIAGRVLTDDGATA